MKFQERPCGFCASRPVHLRSESFTDAASAFQRHAQLVAAGQSPSFCRRRDGSCHVCHLAPGPSRGVVLGR